MHLILLIHSTILFSCSFHGYCFSSGDKGEKGLPGIPGGKGKAGIICSFFFFFKLIFIVVWLLYNVVLVSTLQQNESATFSLSIPLLTDIQVAFLFNF